MTATVTRACATFLLLALLIPAGPVAAQRGPAPAPAGLPARVLALACAPVTATGDLPPLRVTGGQDSFRHTTYAPGDLVTINAGTDNGIEVGQEFYVRRLQRAAAADMRDAAPTRHTAGWIRIHAVDDRMSLATITHACDAITVDDYLDPFSPPVVPAASPDKPRPERDNYARVRTGADGRYSFGLGDFFVIDRGSNGGITPGAQLVVYRDQRADGSFLYELGEAVAMEVGPDSATLRVTLSRDAFAQGDYVALRRQPTRR